MTSPQSCPEALERAWSAGLELLAMGDKLRIRGGDSIPDGLLEPLVLELKRQKVACLRFLKEKAFLELFDLTRSGLLRWTAFEEGAFMPDHPPPPERFYDVFRVEDLRYQAQPLPYEHKAELLELQEQAERERLAARGWQV